MSTVSEYNIVFSKDITVYALFLAQELSAYKKN